jgi:hypothetical protein
MIKTRKGLAVENDDKELQLCIRAMEVFDQLPKDVKRIISTSDCGFSNSDIIKIKSWCDAGMTDYVINRLKMQDYQHRRQYSRFYATTTINIKI